MSNPFDAMNVIPCCLSERFGVDILLLTNTTGQWSHVTNNIQLYDQCSTQSIGQLVCNLELLVQKLAHLRVQTVEVWKSVVFP